MASDNFNRADGGLGANWTGYHDGGGAAPQIVSNSCRGDGGNESFAQWTDDVFDDDQFSEWAVGSVGLNSGNWAGAYVRCPDRDHGYLVIYFNNSGTYVLDLFSKTASASFSLLGSSTIGASPLSAGQIVRIEAEGTTIRSLIDGVTLISVTDTTYSSGAPGIAFHADLTDASIDNWAGGDLHPAVAFIPRIVEYA